VVSSWVKCSFTRTTKERSPDRHGPDFFCDRDRHRHHDRDRDNDRDHDNEHELGS
jgi:hypothetical protein